MTPDIHLSGGTWLTIEAVACLKWTYFIVGSMAGAMIGYFIAKLFGMRGE